MSNILLRPRRPRSYTTMSSSMQLLGSKCDTCHEMSTITAWNTTSSSNCSSRCPDALHISDESTSSSYSDSDDEDLMSVYHATPIHLTPIVPISQAMNHPSIKASPLHYNASCSTMKELSQHHHYRNSDKEILPLCRVPYSREKVLAQRATLVRTFMTLFAIAAVAVSFISSNQYQKHSAANDIPSIRLRRETVPAGSGTSSTNVVSQQPQQQDRTDEAQIRKRRLTQVALSKKIHANMMVDTSSSSTTVAATTKVLSIAQEAKIRRNAMKRLVDQYGMGPHLVEFELQIWQESIDTSLGKATTTIQPIKSYFTIEMAPVHMMPSTVHVFLQQVSAGLWNNTSFYLNTDHLFAAHPISGNGKVSKRSAFAQSSFGSLQYTEYNSAYPHLQYTLGFVGYGPEFYINKASNIHHNDPCFANVVIGRATVDTLFRMKGNDRTPTRIRPVEIVSARIIQRNNLHPRAMAEYVQATIQLQ